MFRNFFRIKYRFLILVYGNWYVYLLVENMKEYLFKEIFFLNCFNKVVFNI